jgi:hypothetical protein
MYFLISSLPLTKEMKMSLNNETIRLLKQILAVQMLNNIELKRINNSLEEKREKGAININDVDLLSDLGQKLEKMAIEIGALIEDMPSFSRDSD